jgi:hypothetical protein
VTTFPVPWVVGHRTVVDGVDDGYGNATRSWSDPVDVPVYGWAPAGTGEPVAGRDEVTWDLDLYAPPGLVVSSRDRFVVDGVEFDVDGVGRDFTHGPFGFAPGVVVRLRRVEG